MWTRVQNKETGNEQWTIVNFGYARCNLGGSLIFFFCKNNETGREQQTIVNFEYTRDLCRSLIFSFVFFLLRGPVSIIT